MMKYTIADSIWMSSQSYPDRIAIEVLHDDGSAEQWTYSTMWDRVRSLAAGLTGIGSGPAGPMAAILLQNSADALLAYLACQVAGVGAVPVNTRLAPPEMQYVVEDSGARVILAASPYLDIAFDVAATCAHEVRVIDASTVVTESHPHAAFVADGASIGGVFYTSGTTGFPKGAMVANGDWLVNALRWGWQLGIRDDEVMLVPGPIFHLSFGSFALCTLMIGGRLRIMPTFDAARACDEFVDTCTMSFLVPSMTAMISEHWRNSGGAPMPALRTMMTSAAAITPGQLEEAYRMFPNVRIIEVYGWTEAGFASFETKHIETVQDATVGWAHVGCEVALFDDDGHRIRSGRGEIGVRTIAHFAGYLNKPGATDAAFQGEYLMSGDIGELMPDGRLKIVDRKKQMIISGGENIYSAEVERTVLEHPSVKEVAVVGKADERWGEIVVACVVPADPTAFDLDVLRAHCRRGLAGYKNPREFLILDELPRNSMGKVQKFVLADRVAGRTSTGVQ
mgnify:CR=1 FL=1